MISEGKSKGRITNYFALVKFSHTIFAMPFALIGMYLAMRMWNELPEATKRYIA